MWEMFLEFCVIPWKKMLYLILSKTMRPHSLVSFNNSSGKNKLQRSARLRPRDMTMFDIRFNLACDEIFLLVIVGAKSDPRFCIKPIYAGLYHEGDCITMQKLQIHWCYLNK